MCFFTSSAFMSRLTKQIQRYNLLCSASPAYENKITHTCPHCRIQFKRAHDLKKHSLLCNLLVNDLEVASAAVAPHPFCDNTPDESLSFSAAGSSHPFCDNSEPTPPPPTTDSAKKQKRGGSGSGGGSGGSGGSGGTRVIDPGSYDVEDGIIVPHHLPSAKEMYKMLCVLTAKQAALERQIHELVQVNALSQKQIKKDAIQWLNEHIRPVVNFQDLHKRIPIVNEDVDMLKEHNLFDTLQHVFSRSLFNFDGPEHLPIWAFPQRLNILYGYINDTEKWVALSVPQAAKFFTGVVDQFIRQWRVYKRDWIYREDYSDEVADMISMKLLSVDMKADTTIHKYIASVHARLKYNIHSPMMSELNLT